MNRKKLTALVALGAAGTFGVSTLAVGNAGGDDYSATLAAKINPDKPKNVILFVGDGMGDSEMTVARYYGKGAAGRMNMDKLPFRGSSVHYVYKAGPGPTYTPNYAGDSAPTATAWSSGKRTIDGRVGQGPSAAANIPGSNKGYRTYMEMAKADGKATGNVSTAEITDATPAGPSAHISQRGCQGPANTRSSCASESKANGGLGSIAEQQVDNGFDVVLGGGKSRWTQTLDNSTDTVLTYAQGKGYTQQVGDKAGLDAITSLAGGKVLGLFNNSNMTTEFAPLYARTQAYRDANPAADPQVQGGSDTTRCVETNRPGTEPSLADLTQKSIDLLKDDPEGFTLQVEGASIDKRDHASDLCGQIGETLAMDDALGVAQEFQKKNPDTLIIVTSDHAHTSQIVSAGSKPANGASWATVQTVDGAPMTVAYGTADTGMGATAGGSQAHTGAQVPVWASGPQAANIQGTIDQTDLFGVLNGKVPSKLAHGQNGKDGIDGAAGMPGLNGTNGTNGTNGAPGAAGPAGAAGAAGPAGVAGPAGAAGSNGANGAQGPAGQTGPAGRDAQVSCKVQGSKKVTCTVSYPGSSAKSKKATKAARLVRGKKTVARGTVSSKGKVVFRSAGRLKKGSYRVVAGAVSAKLTVR